MKNNIIESLDGYLRWTVVELNERGFRSLYSCSGLVRDHERPVDPRSAYLCFAMEGKLLELLPVICNRIYNEARHSALEVLGSEQLEALKEKWRKEHDYPDSFFELNYSLMMWDVEVGSLCDLDDNFTRPNITFRIVENFNPDGDKAELDLFVMRRWNKLFEILLSL